MRHRAILALAWRSAMQARFLLFATLVILGGLHLITVGQASSIEETQGFSRLTALVPGFLQRGLGSRSLQLATFKGTIAFGYFHPLIVLVTVMIAIYFTTEPAHEVEAGLVDLTLARPVPRDTAITRAWLLAAGGVSAAGLAMASGTWVGLRLFASPTFDVPSTGTIARLLAHLWAVAMCFGAGGLAVAAGARRWSVAFTGTALAAVALYLLHLVAIAWPPLKPIAWISPFHYYPGLDILAGDAPAFRNIAILLGTTVVLTAIAYWRFEHRDL